MNVSLRNPFRCAPRLTLVLIAVNVLSGCTTTQTTIAKPGLVRDDYAGEWVYTAKPIDTGSFADAVFSDLYLTSWLQGTFDDQGQRRVIQLYESISGQGAGGFIIQSAADSSGTPLTVHRVERSYFQNFLGHAVSAPREVIAIDLPRDFLDQRQTSGLNIRLKGFNNATVIVQIPPEYLASFLAEYDQAIARNAK